MGKPDRSNVVEKAVDLDVDKKLINFDGLPLRHAPTMDDSISQMELCNECKQKMRSAVVLGKEMTVKSAVVEALMAPPPPDAQGRVPQLPGEEKLARFMLAQKIYQARGPLPLGIDELSMIKEITGKVLPSITVGLLWQLLDPGCMERSKTD
jgi:hypothetical protein